MRDGRVILPLLEKPYVTFTENNNNNNKTTSIQMRQKLILTGKKAERKETKNTKVNSSLIISAYVCYLKKKCRAAKDNKINKCTKQGKRTSFFSSLFIDRLS